MVPTPKRTRDGNAVYWKASMRFPLGSRAGCCFTGELLDHPVDRQVPGNRRRSPIFAADLFSFKDEHWRLNILVESVSRIRKAALGVGTVIELHCDVKHHKIRGGGT